MLRTIERHNGYVIQKVTKPNGHLLRYQTGLETAIGTHDTFTSHRYLSEARAAIGLSTVVDTAIQTAPKASYPHNQKGYRADNRKARGISK